MTGGSPLVASGKGRENPLLESYDVERRPVGPVRPAPEKPELYESLRAQILSLAAEKSP